jgi:hypothetical protein
VPPAVQVSSSFNTVPAWAGFALIGLVVGLVVGLIAMRARARRGPPTAYSPEPEEGASPGAAAPEPAAPEEVGA